MTTEKRDRAAYMRRWRKIKRRTDPEWRARMNARRRSGRPTGRAAVPLNDRIWNFVNKTETCWLWTGAVDRDGYGQTTETVNKIVRRLKAHRAVYQLMVGDIPAGLQIDHLCKNPTCVNPCHLEPVPPRINILRSNGPAVAGARNAAKTHCPRNHPYDASNTRIDKHGRRHCKACHG